MALEDLLKGVQTLAIVCNQYGDTGKGKFSDFFAANWADVIARGTGGNNAGHTVVLNGKEKVFHLIPAGITYDNIGKINILGNGMVINPEVLCSELDELDREGIYYSNLKISRDANVILPFHIARDKAKDQSQKKGGIGTTGRGIGPCYADKIARRGVTIGDLYNKDILAEKIKRIREFYPEQSINIEQIIEEIEPFTKRLEPFVFDTVSLLHYMVRNGKKLCIEGAQGLLLSIEHGTYPYVTSCDCSINGTATGVGLSAKAIDLTLGIFKFPYMTRVGAGPFPTELGGKKSEEYCGDEMVSKLRELDYYGVPYTNTDKLDHNSRTSRIRELMNSDDEFVQGVGIRLAANEYGATTGRPRRIGWLDAVAARYAVAINGPMKIVLTKADSLDGIDEFKVAYKYSDKFAANYTDEFTKDSNFLRNITAHYRAYKGYSGIASTTNYRSLPKTIIEAIDDFENFVGAHVAIVSSGPEKEQTIIRA